MGGKRRRIVINFFKTSFLLKSTLERRGAVKDGWRDDCDAKKEIVPECTNILNRVLEWRID